MFTFFRAMFFFFSSFVLQRHCAAVRCENALSFCFFAIFSAGQLEKLLPIDAPRIVG